MWQLTLVRRTSDGTIVEKPTLRGPGPFSVGRARSNDVRIANPNLGRSHCSLWIDEDGVVSVADFGTVNGTFVNGEQIDRRVLAVGDRIELHGTTLELAAPVCRADEDADALLRAIRAAPGEDASVLVLGDWLVERGDPRGELIGVACALERQARDDRFVALALRARELLPAAVAEWRKWLDLPESAVITLRRGVPSFIGPLTAQDVSGRCKLLAQLPLEHLRISFEPWAVPLLMKVPRLPCTKIDLYQADKSQVLDDSVVDELGRWQALAGVDELALSLRARDLRPLVGSPQLARLSSLALFANLTDAGLRQLRFPAQLRALDLGLGHLGPAACDDLASRAFPRLESLRLSFNPLQDEGIFRLARAPFAPGLRTLVVSSTQVGARSARILGETMRGLTRLDIEGAPIGRDGLGALLAGCSNLERLILRRTMLDDRAAEILARDAPPKLETLDVANNLLTEAACAAIARSPRLGASLRELLAGDVDTGQTRGLAAGSLPPTLRLVVGTAENPATRDLRARFPLLEQDGYARFTV